MAPIAKMSIQNLILMFEMVYENKIIWHEFTYYYIIITYDSALFASITEYNP